MLIFQLYGVLVQRLDALDGVDLPPIALGEPVREFTCRDQFLDLRLDRCRVSCQKLQFTHQDPLMLLPIAGAEL